MMNKVDSDKEDIYAYYASSSAVPEEELEEDIHMEIEDDVFYPIDD